MRIRKSVADDFEAILAVINDAAQAYRGRYQPIAGRPGDVRRRTREEESMELLDARNFKLLSNPGVRSEQLLSPRDCGRGT
jgi:hypothetical protein